MIVDFTFSGIGPFKDNQTLTFESSDKDHLGSSYVREIELDQGRKIKLLRVAILYGANGAGKSTVIEAIDLFRSLVTQNGKDHIEKINANFFSFDEFLEASKLSIKFIRSGKIYRYEVHFDYDGIIFENLSYQETPPDGVKFVKIFQREKNYESEKINITYGQNQKPNKDDRDSLKDQLFQNETMLYVMNKKTNIRNFMASEAYLWFQEELMSIIEPNTNLIDLITSKLASQEIHQNYIGKIFRSAGIPIVSLNIKNNVSASGNIKKEIHTVYKIHGNEYELNLNTQESSGTKHYYCLAGLLSLVCKNNTELPYIKHGRILLLDEIKHFLHPDLLEHFLVTFLNDSSNSQLIVTTHYRELLQNNLLFRDDVIWFVDKDDASLSSQLYCLHDVKTSACLREISSVYNFYKQGRLGAAPKLEK